MVSEVSVLGLGNMGYALARAFDAAGRPTTVWNRTPGRNVGLQAEPAPSAATALAASPLSVICLSDNAAVRALLDTPEAVSAVKGRTIVNLSTGVPREAGELQELFHDAGAEYLDGIIPDYPEAVGTKDLGIVYSGSEQVWNRNRELLTELGGKSWYAGESVGVAAAIDMAMCINFYHTAIGAFVESAVFARHENVSFESIERVALELVALLRHQIPIAVAEMRAGKFDTDQADIDVHWRGTEMAAEAMSVLAGHRDLHIAPLVADLRRAHEAGLGDKSLPALSTQLLP
ncbi:NAD(P)-binding domain-containing protein [Gordonia aurantiaca]|uniref:NAD(P)-binding domain-containing protein n=1 Tax=Gordonia sp. B21 TaxID=3151852 RepID=UPI003266DF6E